MAAACPIFGRRCVHAHYLQPPAQLGIGPSQRRLELASLPQWHRDNQRLPLLCCSCPLSLVAYRLARVTGRQGKPRENGFVSRKAPTAAKCNLDCKAATYVRLLAQPEHLCHVAFNRKRI